MRKRIKLDDNQFIFYKFKHHYKAKGIRISIHKREGLVATAPRWVGRKLVENFILEKADWVLKNLTQSYQKDRENNNLEADYHKHKELARRLVKDKISRLNDRYGFKFNRIFIRDQKTLWGSCSSRKNLNFNYRIIFLPDNLQDYLIIHEICHLGEMNHSPSFWRLVALSIPNYKKIRKDLKEKSKELLNLAF